MARNKEHKYDILKLKRFRLLKQIRYRVVKMKKIGAWATLLIKRPVSPGKPAFLLIVSEMITTI